jgi:hypothetical protein
MKQGQRRKIGKRAGLAVAKPMSYHGMDAPTRNRGQIEGLEGIAVLLHPSGRLQVFCLNGASFLSPGGS